MALTRFHYYRRYIPACDAWIVIAEDEDTGLFWFPIRPACRALRIDSPSQVEAIKKNWRIGPALELIAIPTDQRPDGTWLNAQETQCLPWREFAWWLALADARAAPSPAQEKLLFRQRALMDIAESVMKHSGDAEIEQVRRAALQAGAKQDASGEVHTRCPVCHSALCLVISGAHLVAGAEVE